MSTTTGEKRNKLVTTTLTVELVLIGLVPWIPSQGNPPQLVIRGVCCAACMLLAVLVVLFRKSVARFLIVHLAISVPVEKRAHSRLVAVFILIDIAIGDAFVLWFSQVDPGPHTPALTRNLIITLLTWAGLTWWLLGLLYPEGRPWDLSDYAMNSAMGMIASTFAWLILPPLQALPVFALTVVWLLLIRRFRWLPQLRTKRPGEKAG
jgi:hypothetical protein